MKTHQVEKVDANPAPAESLIGFPGQASLAALRAWYAGLNARAAVAQYLGHDKADGESSRAMLSAIRKQLASFARARHREDLAALLEHRAAERLQRARVVLQAIETVRLLPTPAPLVTDRVNQWLPARAARALEAHGIKTLADLTVRVSRRRRWWPAVPGLGATGARQIEVFFASHPELTERARALIPIAAQHDVVPWDRLYVPEEVDGSHGTFRAPAATCTMPPSLSSSSVRNSATSSPSRSPAPRKATLPAAAWRRTSPS